ncbi:oligosaccharide flippase family protein [Haloimpatiens sp. FM7330]|uniref:putative polysaccharide biosynthesis protein n=1 Tax=Haloimpatiens sp. FM7330 TaxID=3298610 RepID=UPI0036393B47
MKSQSTGKGFAILSSAQIISRIVSILYLPFLINILSEKGYGIYGSAYIIFSFIYVITNAGIPVAISKIMSEFIAVENYKDAIKSFKMARAILIFLGIVMSVLMFFLAEPLCNITQSQSAVLSIKALSPTIFFTSILSAYRGYFQGRANMIPTAISQVIEQIVNMIFSLVFAALLMKYGPEVGAAGGTVGTSLGALVACIYLIMVYNKNKYIKVSKKHNVRRRPRHTNKRLFKKIIYYALPMVVCVGLQNAGTLIDLWNVKSRLIAAGFAAQKEVRFGWLTKYNSLINVPIGIIGCLQAALLPAISGAAAVNNKKEVERKINYAFRVCFLISVPSAFGLAVLSKPIYLLLHIHGGDQLMLLGAVVVIFWSAVQIQTTILQGLGRLYIVTLYAVLGLICKISINYVLVGIPKLNILGAVFGNMACFIVPLILNYFTINKILKIKVNLIGSMKKPIFASIIMSIAAFTSCFGLDYLFSLINEGYLSNAVATIISIGISGLIYLYVLICIKGITKKDLDVIPNKIRKVIPKKFIQKMR